MISLYAIGEFLHSEWIWSITYGLYHVPVTIFIMLLCIKWAERMHVISALGLSLIANLFSVLVFNVFVIGVLIILLNFTYDLPYDVYVIHIVPLRAGLYLGAIYTFIQIVFFALLQFWNRKINVIRLSLISLLSNCLTAFLLSIFIGEL